MFKPHFTTLALLAGSIGILATSSHAGQFKQFIYTDDGTSVTITGNSFERTSTAPLSIPETINGKPVKAIGPWAFSGLNISRITIPPSVNRIGDFAFSQCLGLVSVKFPASITSIGKAAFAGSENYERGLSSVIFTGKAPTVLGNPFKDAVPGFKIFVEEGAAGFTIPRWNGSKVSKPAPEIEVFDPEIPVSSYYKSAYYKSGVSVLKFKDVLIGNKSTWKTLLLRNVGSRDLANLKLSVAGDASGDFIVKGLTQSKLKPGGMVALKLCFKPLKRGFRKCELRITSNDTDESPFIVPVRGVSLEAVPAL